MQWAQWRDGEGMTCMGETGHRGLKVSPISVIPLIAAALWPCRDLSQSAECSDNLLHVWHLQDDRLVVVCASHSTQLELILNLEHKYKQHKRLMLCPMWLRAFWDALFYEGQTVCYRVVLLFKQDQWLHPFPLKSVISVKYVGTWHSKRLNHFFCMKRVRTIMCNKCDLNIRPWQIDT